MPNLLIIHHSRTGAAQQMAEAAADAAVRALAETFGPYAIVRLLPAVDARPADLLDSDGYIFAAPENLAALSGPMKDFFDRCYYPLLGRLNGRPYALMIAAGSDGTGAARQATRIATGWRLRPIADPLIIRTHAQTEAAILAPKILDEDDLDRCRELGGTMGAGLGMGIF